jgi:hypothetical protein
MNIRQFLLVAAYVRRSWVRCLGSLNVQATYTGPFSHPVLLPLLHRRRGPGERRPFGIWLLELFWDLGFGIWSFPPRFMQTRISCDRNPPANERWGERPREPIRVGHSLRRRPGSRGRSPHQLLVRWPRATQSWSCDSPHVGGQIPA